MPNVKASYPVNPESLEPEKIGEPVKVSGGVMGRLGEWIGKKEFTKNAVEWVARAGSSIGDYFSARLDKQISRAEEVLKNRNQEFQSRTEKLKGDLKEAYETIGGPISDEQVLAKVEESPAFKQDKKALLRQLESIESKHERLLRLRGWVDGKVGEMKDRMVATIELKKTRTEELLKALRWEDEGIKQRLNKLMGERSEIVQTRKELSGVMEKQYDPRVYIEFQKKFGEKIKKLESEQNALSVPLKKYAEELKKLEVLIRDAAMQVREYELELEELQKWKGGKVEKLNSEEVEDVHDTLEMPVVTLEVADEDIVSSREINDGDKAA